MNVQSENPVAVMDAGVVEERILSRMKQRTNEIAERSERRRNEQTSRNTELETADAFLASFAEMKAKLEKDLEDCVEGGGESRDAMLKRFDGLVRDHGLMQQYLTESSMFLAAFQLKRSQEILTELNEEIQKKMETLQPKQRFGFISKQNQQKSAKPKISKCEDATDSASCFESKSSALDKIIEQSFFGFKDKSNERLLMEANTMQHKQLNLQNLSHCTVLALGSPGSVQATSLSHCTVLVGPSSRSAFVKDCHDCTFVMACQQVRIHDTSDTEFYLHVTGAAIIESCCRVGFAPYNLEYPGLSEHYAGSGLDTNVNNWDKVEDFKWISRNESSPNMYLIEENLRKIGWL